MHHVTVSNTSSTHQRPLHTSHRHATGEQRPQPSRPVRKPETVGLSRKELRAIVMEMIG